MKECEQDIEHAATEAKGASCALNKTLLLRGVDGHKA